MRLITEQDFKDLNRKLEGDISFSEASAKLAMSLREFIIYHHSESEDDIQTQKMAYEVEFYILAILNRFGHSSALCIELFDILWSQDDDQASEFLLCCLGSEDVEVSASRLLMWLLFEHGENNGEQKEQEEASTKKPSEEETKDDSQGEDEPQNAQ